MVLSEIWQKYLKPVFLNNISSPNLRERNFVQKLWYGFVLPESISYDIVIREYMCVNIFLMALRLRLQNSDVNLPKPL